MNHSSLMPKTFAIIALAAGLAGCGAADLVSNGLSYTRAVEADLEQATGIKPEVGFNWRNGGFQTVTVFDLSTRLVPHPPATLPDAVPKGFQRPPGRPRQGFWWAMWGIPNPSGPPGNRESPPPPPLYPFRGLKIKGGGGKRNF